LISLVNSSQAEHWSEDNLTVAVTDPTQLSQLVRYIYGLGRYTMIADVFTHRFMSSHLHLKNNFPTS